MTHHEPGGDRFGSGYRRSNATPRRRWIRCPRRPPQHEFVLLLKTTAKSSENDARGHQIAVHASTTGQSPTGTSRDHDPRAVLRGDSSTEVSGTKDWYYHDLAVLAASEAFATDRISHQSSSRFHGAALIALMAASYSNLRRASSWMRPRSHSTSTAFLLPTRIRRVRGISHRA
jgi:hypothetical protein